MGGTHLSDQREGIPHETLANCLDIQRCGGHTSRPLYEHVERILHGEFELFWSEGKQQREDGIPEQTGFHEVRARDSEIGEGGLERRAVPKCDCDGFFLGHSVGNVDVGRVDERMMTRPAGMLAADSIMARIVSETRRSRAGIRPDGSPRGSPHICVREVLRSRGRARRHPFRPVVETRRVMLPQAVLPERVLLPPQALSAYSRRE